jgi:hypothetical protein
VRDTDQTVGEKVKKSLRALGGDIWTGDVFGSGEGRRVPSTQRRLLREFRKAARSEVQYWKRSTGTVLTGNNKGSQKGKPATALATRLYQGPMIGLEPRIRPRNNSGRPIYTCKI